MVLVIGLLTTWMRPLLSTVAIPATVEAKKPKHKLLVFIRPFALYNNLLANLFVSHRIKIAIFSIQTNGEMVLDAIHFGPLEWFTTNCFSNCHTKNSQRADLELCECITEYKKKNSNKKYKNHYYFDRLAFD